MPRGKRDPNSADREGLGEKKVLTKEKRGVKKGGKDPTSGEGSQKKGKKKTRGETYSTKMGKGKKDGGERRVGIRITNAFTGVVGGRSVHQKIKGKKKDQGEK